MTDETRKDTFVFHGDWFRVMDSCGMDDMSIMRVLRALNEYNETGAAPPDGSLNAVEMAMFAMTRVQRDKDFKAWQGQRDATHEARVEAGRKGGMAKAAKAAARVAEEAAFAENTGEAVKTAPSPENVANVANVANASPASKPSKPSNVMSCSEVSCSEVPKDIHPPTPLSGGPAPAAPGVTGSSPAPDMQSVSTETADLPADPPESKPPKPRKPKATLSAEDEARFSRFYALYPKHVAKEAARRAWVKIRADDALTDTICAGVETAKRMDSRFRGDGQYVPNPATWLNGREWENEYDTANTAAMNTPPPAERSTQNAYDIDWDKEVIRLPGLPQYRRAWEERARPFGDQ